MRISAGIKIKVTREMAFTWLLFCLISRGALQLAISKVLTIVRLSSLSGLFLGVVMLAPLAIVTIGKINKVQEVFLFAGIYLFFLFLFFTVGTFHPEYEQYYTRPVFGIDEVFFGIRRGAIWGLLAFMGLRDGKKVLKCFHFGTAVLLSYSLFELYKARTVGYWETYGANGELTKLNYSLTFGYQVILCCIVFTYFFLEKKRWYDLCAAILGLILVVLEGSRGPLICLVAFLIMYFLVRYREMNSWKKMLYILLIALSYMAISFLRDRLFSWLINQLVGLNANSRTISMLISGNFSSDSARGIIYDMCWEHIANQGFLGMGPFGNRTFIASRYYWGYPHNIVLELILDYGWFLAVAIMGFMVFAIIQMFRKSGTEELMVLCILLSYNFKLFLSSTYWAEYLFWGMLGWMIVSLKPHVLKKGKV